jgi:hypothetical protein
MDHPLKGRRETQADSARQESTVQPLSCRHKSGKSAVFDGLSHQNHPSKQK